MAVELMSTMDNRYFGQYPSMSAVSTYLSPEPYASNAGQYYGSPSPSLSYSYPQSSPSVNSNPSNLTLFSCSERAVAKEVGYMLFFYHLWISNRGLSVDGNKIELLREHTGKGKVRSCLD